MKKKRIVLGLLALVISFSFSVFSVSSCFARPVVDDPNTDDARSGNKGSNTNSNEGSGENVGDDGSGSGKEAYSYDGDCASLFSSDWCDGENNKNGEVIFNLIKLVIHILTAGIVVAGTVGIVWCGFLILTSRDNEQQVASARKRLIDIVIGIVLFVLLSLIVDLLLPDGEATKIIGN